MSRMNETPAPRRRIRTVALAVIVLVVALVLVQSALAAGAVSLTTLGVPYTENFDTLATSGTTNSSLPNGWWLAESGTNANGLYQAGTGSGNAGGHLQLRRGLQSRTSPRGSSEREPEPDDRRGPHQ